MLFLNFQKPKKYKNKKKEIIPYKTQQSLLIKNTKKNKTHSNIS